MLTRWANQPFDGAVIETQICGRAFTDEEPLDGGEKALKILDDPLDEILPAHIEFLPGAREPPVSEPFPFHVVGSEGPFPSTRAPL